MSETRTAVRTNVPVTFGPVTYEAGTVFEDWAPGGGDAILIAYLGHVAQVSMDDATPVEWDETEQAWIEE